MNKLSNGTWDEPLMCKVVSLSYDFRSHTGHLHMRDGDCCHLPACVTKFEEIDPKVIVINTYSRDKPDAIYRRVGAQWRALESSGGVRGRNSSRDYHMAGHTDGWGRRKGYSAYDCNTVINDYFADSFRTASDIAKEIQRRFPNCRGAIPEHVANLAVQGYLTREKNLKGVWAYKVSGQGKRTYHS